MSLTKERNGVYCGNFIPPLVSHPVQIVHCALSKLSENTLVVLHDKLVRRDIPL